jgi:kynureninase
MNGTTHIPSLEACRPGLKIIREAGLTNIRDKSKRQTARLIELADQHGWRINTPRDPEKRGGTVSIDMPESQQVCQDLVAREILVDWRPRAGVRFSPHFYNTDEEIDLAIAAVEEILKGRAASTMPA